MNIKKWFTEGERGNAILISMLALSVGSISMLLINQNTQNHKQSAYRNIDSELRLNFAHTITAALKSDLKANAESYFGTNLSTLVKCFGQNPLIKDFLRIYKGECASAMQKFDFFVNEKNQKNILPKDIFNKPLKFIGNKGDRFQGVVVVKSINPIRNFLSGSIKITSIVEKGLDLGEDIDFNIDVSRVIRDVKINNSCEICKASAGSVCCDVVESPCTETTADVRTVNPLLAKYRNTYTNAYLNGWNPSNFENNANALIATEIDQTKLISRYNAGNEFIDRHNGCQACNATVTKGLNLGVTFVNSIVPAGGKILPSPAPVIGVSGDVAWGWNSLKYYLKGEVYEAIYFYIGYSGGYDENDEGGWDGEYIMSSNKFSRLATVCQ